MSSAMSTQDAARILGVTRVRVWQMIQEKKLVAERFGPVWSILPESVRAYLKQRAKEPKK